MRTEYTHIAIVLDSSGSMSPLRSDTIGSFNTFLKEQKALPGEATLTLTTFNERHQLVHDFVKLADVPELNPKTYRPEGGTALLDSLGFTIDSVGTKLAALPEEERPAHVLVVVQTDGEENSSHQFTYDRIKQMVEHQQSVYSWNFVFIGAGIDAFATGTSMGFTGSNSVGYTPTAAGTHDLYKSISTNTRSLRSSKSTISESNFFGQTGVTPTSPATPPATPTPDNTNNGTTK